MLAKQLLDSLFGEGKSFLKTPKTSVASSLFDETTNVATKVTEKATYPTPAEIINHYGLLNEAGTTAEEAFKEFWHAASKMVPEPELLQYGGLTSRDEVLHVLQDLSREEWQAMRREHIKALRKLEAMENIQVKDSATGNPKFEYKPAPKTYTELFKQDKARVDRLKNQLKSPPVVQPKLFTAFDTATVDNAYTWARRQFGGIYERFKENKKLYLEGPYRDKVEVKVYSADLGTDITLRNPIAFEHWLRAADILSHDFDASSVRNLINDLDIPEEYAPYFNPYDAEIWNDLERNIIKPLLEQAEKDELPLRRIRDRELEIDEFLSDYKTTLTPEDIKLLQAYNRVQAFRYGKNSITRKAIEAGLERLSGQGNLKYYDGSVDAVLQVADSIFGEYKRLRNTIYEPQAKFLLKAWDDISRGGKMTEMPTLRLLDTMSNMQAYRDAYWEFQSFRDEAAANRVYERDHLFDISAARPKPTAKYGGRPDDPFIEFSLKQELSSRTDIIAGYEGITQNFDPDWYALSGKGITNFEYSYMPGEAYIEDMHVISQAIEHMDEELYNADILLDTSYEVPSWEELVTKELFHAGIDTDKGVVDYSEAALRLPDENARQMFSKYATAKIANTLVNFFPLTPDAPRIGSRTVTMPWEAQHLNVLRINDTSDLMELVDEAYALRQTSEKEAFKITFDSDTDFFYKTGFRVKEGLAPEIRDSIFSVLVNIQDAVIDATQQLEKSSRDSITNIYYNLLIGKYLNIGTALTAALQGETRRNIDTMMRSWSLAANSPEDLAKKVYTVAYENFSRVFGNELDTLTMEQAGKIISYGSKQAFAGVLEGFADAAKFNSAKERISEAKRALYAKLNRPLPEPPKEEAKPKTIIRRTTKGKKRTEVNPNA